LKIFNLKYLRLKDNVSDLLGALIDGDLKDVEALVSRRFLLGSQYVCLHHAVRPSDQCIASSVTFGAAVVGTAEHGQHAAGEVAYEASFHAVSILVATN